MQVETAEPKTSVEPDITEVHHSAVVSVEPIRYRAFISYCHRNQAVAKWLHKALETYRFPSSIVGDEGEQGVIPKTVGRIFRDEDELAGAAELGPKLQQALREAQALIVICSIEAAKSYWVDQEIRYFKQVHPDRPVLAVIANGAPCIEQQCFPESLLFGVDRHGEIDRSVTHEPLAPDLQKLDKDTVRLKVVAGLFGISYGDLAQRDIKRAHRQMAIGSAVAAVIVAALAVLSILALSSAHRADRERDRAVQQQQIAEHNADEASRKAWLANVAAQEVRREADMISHNSKSARCGDRAR